MYQYYLPLEKATLCQVWMKLTKWSGEKVKQYDNNDCNTWSYSSITLLIHLQFLKKLPCSNTSNAGAVFQARRTFKHNLLPNMLLSMFPYLWLLWKIQCTFSAPSVEPMVDYALFLSPLQSSLINCGVWQCQWPLLFFSFVSPFR